MVPVLQVVIFALVLEMYFMSPNRYRTAVCKFGFPMLIFVAVKFQLLLRFDPVLIFIISIGPWL